MPYRKAKTKLGRFQAKNRHKQKGNRKEKKLPSNKFIQRPPTKVQGF